MFGSKMRDFRKKKRLANRPLPAIQLTNVDARYQMVENDDNDDLKNVSQAEFPATFQEEAYSIDTNEKEPLYEIPTLK